jgi:hypothetical protein
MSSDADAGPGATRKYLLVVLCEVAVISGLWALGRIFS